MKRSKKRTFKTASAQVWIDALTDALTNAGADLSEVTIEESGNLVQIVTEVQEIEGEQIEVKKKLSVSWVGDLPCRSKDEEGNFIVTETDEEGNPTAYQMEEGYHANLADAFGLEFAEGLEIFTENPQHKWS